jgi:two-component system, NarL family, sensor kinase
MEKAKADIVAAIIVGSILLVILAVFTLLFFLLFVKKRRLMEREKELMEINYQQTLLRSQLEIQDHTFNTISQELHDSIGQSLSLARIQVSLLEHGSNKEGILKDLKDNLGIAMKDLRDIAKALSNDRLSTMRLDESVRTEANRVNKASNIDVNVRVVESARELANTRQVILFRIIQESLQNIIKHAAATVVEIILTYNKDILLVNIQDNGKGFNLDEIERKGDGLGLRNMKTRAALLNGKLSISSRVNEGTLIQLHIPYD